MSQGEHKASCFPFSVSSFSVPCCEGENPPDQKFSRRFPAEDLHSPCSAQMPAYIYQVPSHSPEDTRGCWYTANLRGKNGKHKKSWALAKAVFNVSCPCRHCGFGFGMLLKCRQKSCHIRACGNGGLENAFNCDSTLHNTDCHALSSGLFVSGTDIDTTAAIEA